MPHIRVSLPIDAEENRRHSVAGLFLTTEAVVANKPEPAAPAMPPMDPSMGMGGMM